MNGAIKGVGGGGIFPQSCGPQGLGSLLGWNFFVAYLLCSFDSDWHHFIREGDSGNTALMFTE